MNQTDTDFLDVYETDERVAAAIVKRISSLFSTPPQTILEPSAGSGTFVKACRAQWPASTILSIEVRQECAESLRTAGSNNVAIKDLLIVPLSRRYDLIVGNPPFSAAREHVQHLLPNLAPTGLLVFLLPLQTLALKGWIDTWRTPEASLRHVIPIRPRPKFSGASGTARSECAAFVWSPQEGLSLLHAFQHITWTV